LSCEGEEEVRRKGRGVLTTVAPLDWTDETCPHGLMPKPELRCSGWAMGTDDNSGLRSAPGGGRRLPPHLRHLTNNDNNKKETHIKRIQPMLVTSLPRDSFEPQLV
jgi:hypothetical protein